MSFPGPNQPPSNGGGNKPNGGNNPFTNPFSRNNDGKNGGSGANGNKSNGPRPFWQSPWLWVVVVALLAVTMFQLFAGAGSQTIDTKDGMQILNGNTVEYATIVDNTQQVKLKLSSDYSATDPDTGRTKNYGKNVQFYYTYAQSAAVVKAVQKADPAKGWTASMQQTSIWTYLLTSLLPFLIIFGLFWFLMSRMGGAAGGMFGMGGKKNSGKLLDGQTPTTKFSDVAGEDAAVQEVEEIKDFLKDPSRYKALGARIPRGVLLYGPPGTGKTLLARAIAGEAGVPFYSMAGSDFVEMFVGLGASRVRDLFDEAKKNAPAIIFIDEIDAVGRKRGGSGMSGGHDEREQTLNQLLVEMDGFDNDTNLIIIAATNRPDVLDPALLRPGRFDRQVAVEAPDLEGREAILKVHAKGKPFVPDVDLHMIAVRTPGFTGADLANVLNEAALLCARAGAQLIDNRAIDEAIDRVQAGPKRRSKGMALDELRNTAYHEGGHALVAAAMNDTDPVTKVTILPRGHALATPRSCQPRTVTPCPATSCSIRWRTPWAAVPPKRSCSTTRPPVLPTISKRPRTSRVRWCSTTASPRSLAPSSGPMTSKAISARSPTSTPRTPPKSSTRKCSSLWRPRIPKHGTSSTRTATSSTSWYVSCSSRKRSTRRSLPPSSPTSRRRRSARSG